MNNYTREDILRMVEEGCRIYPSAVYRHFRNHEKHCNYHKSVRQSPE